MRNNAIKVGSLASLEKHTTISESQNQPNTTNNERGGIINGKVTDPALERSFKGHKDGVTSSVFNPNLRQAVSGSLDGTVMVWNFKSMMRPFRFVGHKGPVYDVAVTPNGQTIVSCSADQTMRVWNNTVEGYSQVIKSHSAPVKSVSLSNDGSLLLSGSDDKNIKCF